MSYCDCWVHLFFLSFFFLICVHSGVTTTVRLWVSCLSVFLFCWIIYCYMRLSIQLVHSRFGASYAFLAIHLPLLSSSLCFFSSFANFSFRFFSPTGRNLLRLLVCTFCVQFLLSHFSEVEFLFHFLFVFVGLASDVSSSCFCLILVSCVALLTASLPFHSSMCAGLSSSFLFFWCHCLFLPLRWLPAGISGCCPLFSYPIRSLGHSLFVFSSVMSLSFPKLKVFA